MPIFTSPQIRVSINKQDKGTIRTVGIVAPTTLVVDKLIDLKDVDASDVDNNETLVYDETTNKFVVKVLPTINGGSY